MLEGRNIICFAPNDWWGMNPSCATHLMRRFARSNKVLFVNPFSSDLFSAKRRGLGRRIWRKMCSIGKFLRKPEPNLYVFSPLFLPMHGHRWIDAMNNGLLRFQLKLVSVLLGLKRPVLWIENLRAADLLDLFDATVTIYHVSDLFAKTSYAANKKALEQREKTIVARSNLLVCVSNELFATLSTQHPEVHYLPHGVDFELFHAAGRQRPVLSETAGMPAPIVGYFGTLSANNDIELLEYCVRNLPNTSFVFAGQITGGDYSHLAALPNVRFLGKMPYEKIPMLASTFDVCLLVWKVTDWIRSCNPLKMFEYMAAGKPIVSVAINEVAQNYGHLVSVAQNKEEFCQKIVWELQNDSDHRRQERIDIARTHSWEAHVEIISGWIEEAIRRKGMATATQTKDSSLAGSGVPK